MFSTAANRADFLRKAGELGLVLSDRAEAELLDRFRQMQYEGYDISSAEGTLELILREAAYPDANPFEVVGFEVITRMTQPHRTVSSAAVSVKVKDAVFAGHAICDGPVQALDTALRRCLGPLYPSILEPELTDYRVQVLDLEKGTAARASVLTRWTDGERSWSTIGVSSNIIEASWIAITSGLKLLLMRLGEQNEDVLCLEDRSWAV
jgi:2-isopropylmalate synthase